ncbi:MAG: hypothetical protein E7284_12035 [Lachnospiraceae bacterium]|nr:hypothetical protein [Lachnospiraceae bacterium]
MAKYECKVCGYIYNEQHASRSFEELTECPICNEGKENFIALDADGNAIESQSETKADAETVSYEQTVDNVQEQFIEEKQEEAPEFVVERRQEFWSPLSAKAETETVSSNTTGWTISNAMGSVETVIGETEKEETEKEEKETIIDKVEDEEMPVYESRIESFYSSAEPVGASHIISDEEEEQFKPLWNSGGGTVQRVIDPFGDKNDAVVKAENVGMVMPAEEPVVEEILGEEPEEAVAEESKEEVLEEVKEYFFDDEEGINDAVDATEEVVAEEAEDMVAVEEEAAEEFEFEDAVEETATIAEEIKEEFGFEEATEIIEEVAEEALVDEVIKAELEDDDDDFFTEMTIDAVVDNTIDEERDNAGISEEEVFKAIDAITFDDDVPEGGRIEFVTADGAEEILLNEESEDDSPIAEAEEEFSFEEAAEAEEELSFEEAKEAEEEFSFEEAKEAEEEFSFEEVKEAEEDVVTEVAEEAEADAAEAVETAAEEPVIKAWSFLDDVVGAAGTVAGVTYVSKAMDEVVDEEVTEDDIEEVFVNFAEENKEIKSEPEAVAESVQAPVAEKKEESAYCNNLEKILIVPAQLNPMPLPVGTEVQGKTILGIASDRPLVLDNPVFSTGAYNMVQYIPNSGLTSEDYQKADAIEIIVGHGNGIEKTINSKEDLRQVVNFLRLESDGCPIGIKMGAARIERDLEFCVFAKPDYVVLNNFNVVPLPYALHRATKYLNTVQSDMDIVIALDGAKDAEELAKIMAMGADVIALRNKPANMNEMIEGLKNYARITGHYDVEDLNVKDLCTIDREIAEFTDIYHV